MKTEEGEDHKYSVIISQSIPYRSEHNTTLLGTKMADRVSQLQDALNEVWRLLVLGNS